MCVLHVKNGIDCSSRMDRLHHEDACIIRLERSSFPGAFYMEKLSRQETPNCVCEVYKQKV